MSGRRWSGRVVLDISSSNFSQLAFLKFRLGRLVEAVGEMTAGWKIKVGRCCELGKLGPTVCVGLGRRLDGLELKKVRSGFMWVSQAAEWKVFSCLLSNKRWRSPFEAHSAIL